MHAFVFKSTVMFLYYEVDLILKNFSTFKAYCGNLTQLVEKLDRCNLRSCLTVSHANVCKVLIQNYIILESLKFFAFQEDEPLLCHYFAYRRQMTNSNDKYDNIWILANI